MEDGARTYGVKLRYAEQADIPIFALAPRHADLNNPIIECQEMSPGHHLVLALGRRCTPRSPGEQAAAAGAQFQLLAGQKTLIRPKHIRPVPLRPFLRLSLFAVLGRSFVWRHFSPATRFIPVPRRS
jgi:hypothetical protein